MAARKGYIYVGILLSLGIRRMCLGHMLQIGGFLHKLLLRTMRTAELEILNMLRLNMVIHGILLGTPLITILTLELAGKFTGIQLEIGRLSCGGRHGKERRYFMKLHHSIFAAGGVSIFATHSLYVFFGDLRLQCRKFR